MRLYNIKEIRTVLVQKEFKFFYKGLYNLNLIAVRSEGSISDTFDDMLYIIYRNSENVLEIQSMTFTTDAGKHWLLNPWNIRGCIITVPGQYRGAFKLGLHNRSKGVHRSYEAFEQVKPMDYVRDNFRSGKLHFELYENAKNIFTSNCKTNIHRASSYRLLNNVGKYSAGCGVVQCPSEFDFLISLTKCQIKYHGGLGANSFTYTLLEEKDFKQFDN